MLKLLTTQADTEPASVEQITWLGRMAPSNYDLRNLLQINCEEGRHLWAMVHLLCAHFGKDGEREIEIRNPATQISVRLDPRGPRVIDVDAALVAGAAAGAFITQRYPQANQAEA